jgi:elongation factor P--(R)-beta-lysine ligase
VDYPGFNRNWKKSGRVLEVQVKGPHLVLKLKNETIQVFYQIQYESIKINDWIAIDEKNEVVLVASSEKPLLTTQATQDNLKKWSVFLKFVRRFFDSHDFLELHTPSLVSCPGTEPTLDCFSTDLKTGGKLAKFFLPTSPELHLKKALSMGFENIYEVAKCFRNNEVTQIHQPEFWMLEWYRSFASLVDIQVDFVKLVYTLCDQFVHPRPEIKNFTIKQLFKIHINFELKPDTSYEEYKKLAEENKLFINETFSIDDLFFLLMLEKIEPNLPKETLVFVEKYPPFQAALARRDEKGWAERFEVYWKGMELANAFDELNDPHEQRKRANEDLSKREGKSPIPLDEEFFQALESGMPPSAGIALGLERLFMALRNIQNIEEIRLFPIRS